MARWKLESAHYLMVDGTKWEYQEINRATGKPIRKAFDVPTLLDPREPSDWNYRLSQDDGDIIVSDGVAAEPKDIIFKGDPSPDMLPLDDDAKAKSAKFAGRWNHPIESLDGNFSERLLDGLQTQMAAAQASSQTTKVEGMEALLAAMTTMMKQQGDLIAALSARRA